LGLFKNLPTGHYLSRRVLRMSDLPVVAESTSDVPVFSPVEPAEAPPVERSVTFPAQYSQSQRFNLTAEEEAAEDAAEAAAADVRHASKKRRRSPAQTRLVAADIQRILLCLHSLENHIEDCYFLLQELGVHRRECPGGPSMSDEEGIEETH